MQGVERVKFQIIEATTDLKRALSRRVGFYWRLTPSSNSSSSTPH